MFGILRSVVKLRLYSAGLPIPLSANRPHGSVQIGQGRSEREMPCPDSESQGAPDLSACGLPHVKWTPWRPVSLSLFVGYHSLCWNFFRPRLPRPDAVLPHFRCPFSCSVLFRVLSPHLASWFTSKTFQIVLIPQESSSSEHSQNSLGFVAALCDVAAPVCSPAVSFVGCCVVRESALPFSSLDFFLRTRSLAFQPIISTVASRASSFFRT